MIGTGNSREDNNVHASHGSAQERGMRRRRKNKASQDPPEEQLNYLTVRQYHWGRSSLVKIILVLTLAGIALLFIEHLVQFRYTQGGKAWRGSRGATPAPLIQREELALPETGPSLPNLSERNGTNSTEPFFGSETSGPSRNGTNNTEPFFGSGTSGPSRDEKRAASISADKERSSASRRKLQRPVMATFFEPGGDCCGMTERGHHLLLLAWETAWQNRGWDTKVYTKVDAIKNPGFKMLDDKLADLNVDEYNRKCFWRWLVMASIEDEDGNGGGGWMSDYDTFPLGLTAEEGLQIAKLPGFKSYALHVPNIIHGTQVAWDTVLRAMIDLIPEERHPGCPVISDMCMLRQAVQTHSRESLMITDWKRESSGGFMYRAPTLGLDRDDNDKVNKTSDNLVVNCTAAKAAKVAHFSHRDCGIAFHSLHTYPRLVGLTNTTFMDRRGEAALVFMKDFRKQCLDGLTR